MPTERPPAYGGVRIADFTQGVAGPMAAMLLADFGAEVVKVEPPGGERLARQPGYLAFNRGKQVLTLDLATSAGQAEAAALIAGADVALFDDAPSRLRAAGRDAETLTRAHPALVHAWMPPYGVEGPWSEAPPRHSLLAALSGWCWRQGADADQPIHMVTPFGWYGQAVMGATMIGAALFERAHSGRGQGVVVSGLHGFAHVGGPVRVVNEPRPPRATPFGTNPRNRLYRCGDGRFLFLCAFFPSFYRKVFETLGYTDAVDLFLADDEGARNLLDALFADRPRDEWVARLQAAGIPCAPVESREAWLSGEAVREAGLRLVLRHPTLGEVAMPGPPAELSTTPAVARALPQPIAEPPRWAPRAGGPAAAAAPPTRPLAGVRVLNLGMVIAGALPGAILSFLGADVVKIEPPEGDQFRNDPLFLALNRGTRSLGLDMKRADGREAFLEMVRQADVVIDNYRFGVRDRLGIGYAALKAVNPGIISCSVTAYGDRGPRARQPGFDPLLQAEGGMMSAQGGADDPVYLTMGVNDVAAAGVVCAAIVAALNARRASGEGQEVRTSLLASSLLYQQGELVEFADRPPNDEGGWDCLGLRALHRYYACRDGWIGIACETPAEVAALGRALGLDLGAPEAALAAPRDGALAARLAAALTPRPRMGTAQALLEAGAPATPVLDMVEVFEEPWLRRNGYLELWEHPTRGPVITVRGYAELTRTPCGLDRPAPGLAEQSREALAAYGFSPDRIGRLIASGAVFEGAPAAVSAA